MTMQIHNYDATGEYLNTTAADESPLEPGIYHLPSQTTALPLPTLLANEQAVFVDGVWTVVADHRGQTFYDAAANPVVIDKLGAVGATLTAQPSVAALAVQFAGVKSAAMIAVDGYHAETLQRLAGKPTQAEKDSWAMKVATADAVKAGGAVSVAGQAFMAALGLSTPAMQLAWADKVQANTAKFSALVGLADKLRSQAKAAVSAATTPAELDVAQAANKAAAQAAIAALPKA
jgi:hypothetical protein